MLSRHQAEPRGEIPPSSERLWRWRQNCDHRADQRANARDRHQPSRDVALLGTTDNLFVELSDLSVDLGQRFYQIFQGVSRIGGQATFCVLDKSDKACSVYYPLWHHLSELGQMATQGIDRLGALPDQKFPDAEDHGRTLARFTLHRHESHRQPRYCVTARRERHICPAVS